MDGVSERDRVIALLQNNHDFPGVYAFRAVVHPGSRGPAVSAVRSVVASVIDVTEKVSRRGNYLSLRISITADSAEQVLDVYEVLSQVDGVITTL